MNKCEGHFLITGTLNSFLPLPLETLGHSPVMQITNNLMMNPQQKKRKKNKDKVLPEETE